MTAYRTASTRDAYVDHGEPRASMRRAPARDDVDFEPCVYPTPPPLLSGRAQKRVVYGLILAGMISVFLAGFTPSSPQARPTAVAGDEPHR